MSKLKIIDKKSEKSINSEREFLSKLHNSFIVNMHYAFQDSENLYLVMDLMSGGDLRYHISRHKKFSEEQTRFFICGIIVALEYIHGNNVIHRDIKPENLVLDNKGYIRLTDFGIAKENMPDNSSETSGTPGYMSPEVIQALNHSFPVDYYALGIIAYEFMKGERPYNGKNRKEIKEQMMNNNIKLFYNNINDGMSKESIDFINKLLVIEPEKRIGYRGINELKNHLWLRYYPWEMLYKKKLPSPFIPENNNNFDKTYCESTDEISKETKLRYDEILLDENYNDVFTKFYYNIDEIEKNQNMKEKINERKMKNKLKIENKKDNTIIVNKNKLIKKNKIMKEIILEKSKNDDSKIKNKKVRIKKKIINSVDLTFSGRRNEKYKTHQKSKSLMNYSNINDISGNVSNNVIYINFNINNPDITENFCKSYREYSPKTDRIIKSYKTNSKNIYYPNYISKNKRMLQKIGFNISRIISPLNSYKKVKQHLLKKNNLTAKTKKYTIPIFEIYNKNKIKKNIFDLHNQTSLIESSFEKNLRFSDFLTFRKNKNSLMQSKNENDLKHISEIKSDTYREPLNKIRKIEMKNLLKKGKYNFLSNNTNVSSININNNLLKKLFFHNYSPYDKMNKMNISSKNSNQKDNSIKTSREFGHRNKLKSNDLSITKPKTYLNQFNISKEKIRENKNQIKTKNIYININKLCKNAKNKSLNESNQILLSSREKNTNFDKDKQDILIDTIDLKNNQMNQMKNINLIKKINKFDNNSIMNKTNFAENSKIIFNPKRKNNIGKDSIRYFSQNINYSMIHNKYINYQTNNLSFSSNNYNKSKRKDTSKNNRNNKMTTNIKYDNKDIGNKKILRKNKINTNKNQIIFSYKQKLHNK